MWNILVEKSTNTDPSDTEVDSLLDELSNHHTAISYGEKKLTFLLSVNANNGLSAQVKALDLINEAINKIGVSVIGTIRVKVECSKA